MTKIILGCTNFQNFKNSKTQNAKISKVHAQNDHAEGKPVDTQKQKFYKPCRRLNEVKFGVAVTAFRCFSQDSKRPFLPLLRDEDPPKSLPQRVTHSQRRRSQRDVRTHRKRKERNDKISKSEN